MEEIKQLKAEIEKLRKDNKILSILAYQDRKLGVSNRNWLDHNKRLFDKKSLFVAMIDANSLKLINDTKGHNAGDNYLQDIVFKIRKAIEKLGNYHLVRVGGDEFVLIIIGEIFISEKTICECLDSTLGVCASYGVYYKNESASFYKAMKEADKRMYQNKQLFYSKKNGQYTDGNRYIDQEENENSSKNLTIAI